MLACGVASLHIAFVDASYVVAKETTEALPVTATRVRVDTTGTSYEMLGTVIPRRKATIGFAVAGRVKSLSAERGRRVGDGEIVCELQTQVIRIEIAAAKAQLRLAEEQLSELEAGSRSEDIAEAQARMDAAAALARQAKSQLTRILRLAKSKAASVDEVDVATAEADSTDRLFEAAKIVHQRLLAGPRIEQVAQARARVDLQREQVKLLEDRLGKHSLRAPFAGYVVEKFSEAGSWVSAGDPVIELIELDTIDVEVPVPASELGNLKIGQAIRLQSNRATKGLNSPTAMSPGNETERDLLIGHIDRIVPSADSRSRTYPVLIRLQNPTETGLPSLLNGMLVRAEMPIGPPSQSLFVPTDSVVLEGDSQSVFVIETNETKSTTSNSGRVRKVNVRLGVANGDWVAVEGELSEGDLVVTRGNERLIAGQTVEATTVDG